MNNIFRPLTLAISLLISGITSAQAATIYASGQRFIPAVPGEHDDLRENFIYEIDTETGVAVPISPQTSGLPSALAGTSDQRLLGFKSGQLLELNPITAETTTIATFPGLDSTGLNILENGQTFVIPIIDSQTQQLYRLDIDTQTAIPLGNDTAVGDAIDTARGAASGTAEPFIISLGSVNNTIYGVDLDTDSLISFNANTGDVSVVGEVGAVSAGERSGYSGFSALTGVDTNNDGSFDALFGSVNYFNDERLGGIARYNLTDGTWDLVGTNEGVIFFGFGSSSDVPEPSSMIAVLFSAAVVAWKRNSRHK